ncbi:MAG TPA: hypothetical protein PLY40_05525, partial [Bacillota bacterium]|nr:hypothetical protein [Bacillota bacterium]
MPQIPGYDCTCPEGMASHPQEILRQLRAYTFEDTLPVKEGRPFGAAMFDAQSKIAKGAAPRPSLPPGMLVGLLVQGHKAL